MPNLRLHGRLASSRANGPGQRAVLWLQGCTLGCKGCFNPKTHAADGGEATPVERLVAEVLALTPKIEGLTVSGGEPFQQPDGLAALLEGLALRSALSTLVFSGYRLEEIQAMARGPRILEAIDVLVAGRYVPSLGLGCQPGRGLLGSSNQRVHFLSPRYTAADLDPAPSAEIQIDAQGRIAVTGIAPPALSALAASAREV